MALPVMPDFGTAMIDGAVTWELLLRQPGRVPGEVQSLFCVGMVLMAVLWMVLDANTPLPLDLMAVKRLGLKPLEVPMPVVRLDADSLMLPLAKAITLQAWPPPVVEPRPPI